MINNNDLICNYCGKIIQDLSLTIPCGYLVCASHLNVGSSIITCFICKDHQINIYECLRMPRNNNEILRIQNEKEKIFKNSNNPKPELEMEYLRWEDLSRWENLVCKKVINIDDPNALLYCFKVLENDRIISECGITIKIWDFNGNCLKTFEDHSNRVCCFELLNNELLITGSADKTIKIWNLESTECIKTLEGHQDWVTSLQLYESDKIISGSDDNTIKIWNLENGDCIKTLTGHNHYVLNLKLIDNQILISASADRTIKLWNLTNGESLNTLFGHQNWVLRLEIIKPGVIASGSSDHTIKIWDLEKLKCIKTLIGHTDIIYSLKTMNLDSGVILISGSRDLTVKIWDVVTCRCLKTLEGHSNYIYSLQILPNGEILSGSADRTIRVWN